MDDKKEEKEYSESDMLVEYNPFGTNTLSLYVYFESEQAENVSCTIHVEDETIPDYTQQLTEDGSYVTEHEYQVLGLVPDHQNEIIFTFSLPDGSSYQETITYDMGSLMGTEETVYNAFQVLSDGGVVIEPIGELPWSKCCATVIDKYGV